MRISTAEPSIPTTFRCSILNGRAKSRFIRTWEFYLAFCEAGFRTRALQDYQLVLTRPFNDRLPTDPAPRLAF